ncbi:methyl-accepting chemotaxis protein [Vibrio genomosp. F6]|uniref:methyl-accepting chemotaxis protein n=1 Tax=Vibrio genomosp. F6 TaxID=723172 RepID=UPI0010BE1C6C|nr:methyl-accepting chemotaxis protein [Vibrio genomosp. F6]TKF22317.1 methyl-accepting chemotaxis protein [Vibrio genomosp. F6]
MNGSPKNAAPSRSLSIKVKLLLITMTLFSGIASYAIYEFYSLQKLELVHHAAELNLSSKAELLTLRRHEKDFLMRKDEKYLSKFDNTYIDLESHIASLQPLLMSIDSKPHHEIDELLGSLKSYKNQFENLSQHALLINSESEHSYRAKLGQSRELLHQQLEQERNVSLTLQFIELIEQEYTFVSSPSAESRETFIEALNELSVLFAEFDIASDNLTNYQHHFETFADAMVVFGLSPNSGMRGKLRANVHQTEQALSDMLTQINHSVEVLSTEIKRDMALMGGAIVLIVSSMIIIVSNMITRRINDINTLMSDIAHGSGDLTVRMNAKGSDELAQLSNSFDLFISKLQMNITDIAQVMNVLTECSETSQQAATQSLDNVSKQKAESESVATAVNELVMTSNEITANIESAAHTAHNVKLEAEESMRLTNIAGASTQELTRNIEQSQILIKTLESQSRDIYSVITTIQGIAEQTNLLALNAAIEAARAGENGRGFAVVADEVRQLSHMTNDSTKQIESTISGLKDGVEQTVSLMQTSLGQAHETNEQTKNAASSITKIVDQISEMFDMNSQIATASEEQSMVSAEIDRNITQIAELAGDTSNLVVKSVHCSEHVTEVSEKLERVVGQFKY